MSAPLVPPVGPLRILTRDEHAAIWIEDFLESYPLVNGVAKRMTDREKKLVRYAFEQGLYFPMPEVPLTLGGPQ